MTNDRLAGFGREVVRVARAGDEMAADILKEAGRQLGIAAAAVIRKLHLEKEEFPVVYVGGVYGAGDLVLDPMRAEIKCVAKKAYLARPLYPPTIAATRIAQAHFRDLLALAV
jgi:N-acetylglucosamine kinase-like BadF-type ATPase